MRNLKARLKKQGGFTLIEMLIVVAIIAILIAVSIPLVNSALERAREATDAANERSFKAELLVCYLSGEMEGTPATSFAVGTLYAYDAANGVLKSDAAPASTYGKSTKVKGVDDVARTGYYLCGFVDVNGQVQMGWYNSFTASSSTTTLPTGNLALISPKMIPGKTDTTT